MSSLYSCTCAQTDTENHTPTSHTCSHSCGVFSPFHRQTTILRGAGILWPSVVAYTYPIFLLLLWIGVRSSCEYHPSKGICTGPHRLQVAFVPIISPRPLKEIELSAFTNLPHVGHTGTNTATPSPPQL